MTDQGRPRGRVAEAMRNDIEILQAARRVFVRDPSAPISAVAAEASVGISALYKRYPSKEDLLRSLCTQGLEQFAEIARAALDEADPGPALEAMVTRIVEADVHSLTVRLAGTFSPSPTMHRLADESSTLATQVFDRAVQAGAVRPGVDVKDLSMLFEQLSAVRMGDDLRTLELRRRYLAMQLDSLRQGDALPGDPPTGAELSERWVPPGPLVPPPNRS